MCISLPGIQNNRFLFRIKARFNLINAYYVKHKHLMLIHLLRTIKSHMESQDRKKTEVDMYTTRTAK